MISRKSQIRVINLGENEEAQELIETEELPYKLGKFKEWDEAFEYFANQTVNTLGIPVNRKKCKKDIALFSFNGKVAS